MLPHITLRVTTPAITVPVAIIRADLVAVITVKKDVRAESRADVQLAISPTSEDIRTAEPSAGYLK